MARRVGIGAGLVVAVGLVLWWGLRPGESVPSGDASEVALARDAGGAGGAQSEAPVRAFARRLAAQSGALEGRVVGADGRGVPGASLLLKGPVRRFETTGSAGRFLLKGLPPGEYVLEASFAARSAEPLGPVPLGAGEELRDLTLLLEAGASLSGVVLDAQDRRPVSGASLAASAATSTADVAGRFVLEGLPAGTLSLVAAAEGYVPRTSQIDVARGQTRSGVEVLLERSARVFGRVATAQGRPVAGAEVVAGRYGFAARLSAVAPVGVTDEEGAFSGNVLPGRLQLIARAPGFAEARTEEFEVAAGAEREANLTLGSGGTVLGQVRDGEGAGIAGCRVEAFDSIHGRVTAQGQSGPGGQYWLAGVPQAVYLVTATCEAGRAEVPGVRVPEGGQAQVDLRLGAGTLAGRVVDSGGRPVAGATISVKVDGSAAPETAAGVSRANGAFELRGLSGARFAVSAVAAQGRAERSGVVAGTRDLVLTLGSAELAGTVVAGGRPVTDFVVYAEPSQLDAGRPRSQQFLSPDGKFRMSLTPGRYGLRVGASGYTAGVVPTVEVQVGMVTTVQVTLSRGAVIRGRALDEKGQPLAGVRVATHPNMLFAFGRAAPVPLGASATSDPQGAFTLNGVPPADRVHVFAAKDGYVQRSPAFASLASGGEAQVEVRLAPGNRPDEPEFAGVGMTLSLRNGGVAVVEVFEGGPAREAGIRPGDVVTHIEGAPTAGLSLQDVIGRIRGEVGTTVTLTVRRENRDTVLSIPRAVVKF